MTAVSQDVELHTLPEILASSSKETVSSSLSSPEAAPYIAHLTSLSLPELEAEPTELASSSAQLTNALTTLCYTSYPTFLSLHTTTSTLSSSLDALSNSLSSLLSTLPALDVDMENPAPQGGLYAPMPLVAPETEAVGLTDHSFTGITAKLDERNEQS